MTPLKRRAEPPPAGAVDRATLGRRCASIAHAVEAGRTGYDDLRKTVTVLRGVKGTPRVLAAVAAVFALQLLFTYAPFMQALFGTRPLSFANGVQIVAAGAAVLIVLEVEKALISRRPARGAASPRPA